MTKQVNPQANVNILGIGGGLSAGAVSRNEYVVTEDEASVAITNSIFAYEQRSLKPGIDELPNSEKKYLRTMSDCLNEDRLAATADIAHGLGTTQSKLSKTRAYLIDNGIIAAPEQGKVMFCIPYLADYVKKDLNKSDVVEIARQRRV